ncbi:MAG: hypothetical protein DYH13_03255 [Alphaproteobacteria bacterium PRO2]|nr:hypothetical protein [Alphaproteobacteria bacterium PRO2]
MPDPRLRGEDKRRHGKDKRRSGEGKKSVRGKGFQRTPRGEDKDSRSKKHRGRVKRLSAPKRNRMRRCR